MSSKNQLTTQQSVAFYTLGCKTNQLETVTLADTFQEKGWRVVPFDSPASLYVINTCTVTERSDHEAKRIMRRARLSNPDCRIAVTGCYAQVAPDELVSGADYVIGNNFKEKLYEIVESVPAPVKPLIQVSEIDKSRIMVGASKSGIDRTRGSLKIQDGCDFKCTYCIIWEARGLSRSLPIDDIKSHLSRMTEWEGFKEVMLTGINIGQYEDNGRDLPDLLSELTALPGRFRLRLTSLDPVEVTDKLIKTVAGSEGKIAPHFHLSAQSADDIILKRMARRHHTADLVRVCETIAEKIPGASIGSDIITGFPGETETHFDNTYQVLEALPMNYFHVFSYSKRRGTPAAGFDGQVPDTVKKTRATRLKTLSEQKDYHYRQKFLGQPLEVLLESSLGETQGEPSDDYPGRGTSANYLRVTLLPSQLALKSNTLVSARVLRVTPEETLAEAEEILP